MIEMKQINVRLEDDLVKEMKIFALNHDFSIKDVIKQALESYITSTIENKQDKNLELKQTKKIESYNDSITARQQVKKKTFEEMYGYDDGDTTEEELEEARNTSIVVDEAPIPVYIEETPIITTYDNSPLSLDDLVPNKPKPEERVSKYR